MARLQKAAVITIGKFANADLAAYLMVCCSQKITKNLANLFVL